MPTPELIALARAAASNHALDFTFSVSSAPYTGAALVCAIIEQESAWNPHAMRYEPGFRTRYVAPLGLPPTEEIARSISWGLMQVMGQVAREHGFQGKFLSALSDPAIGLDIGCAALAAKVTIRPGSSSRANIVSEGPLLLSVRDESHQSGQGIALSEIAHALALWNGGSNPNYAAEVLARLPHYQ